VGPTSAKVNFIFIFRKHFGNERIVQIEAGNEFFLILNNEGTLYGWGQCRNLGKGVFKDGKDEEIENICNEIELLQNVAKLSAGRDHAIASTKCGKVLGWGNLEFLSNDKKEFS
jgi:alpha-tubulin suppressor-like RCC1 family protein